MKLILLRTYSHFESVIVKVNFISVFAFLTYILKRGLYENVKKKTSKEEFNSFKFFVVLVFTYRRIFEI